MNKTEASNRLGELYQEIINNANGEGDDITGEANNVAKERQKKLFAKMRENLIVEFEKKRENEDTRIKTERSLRINQGRLDVQEKRNSLLSELKSDVTEQLSQKIQDGDFYKKVIKSLIVQVRF